MNSEPGQPILSTAAQAVGAWSPDQLVDALNALDVPFLAGGTGEGAPPGLEPAALLAGLAASDEARLRLAVIPLLLRRPEFAAHAEDAAACMPNAARLGFRCFYTAAVYLQQIYRARLDALFGPLPALPNRFAAEVGVLPLLEPEAALAMLARRQAQLSGYAANWRGSYVHAAERLVLHCERMHNGYRH